MLTRDFSPRKKSSRQEYCLEIIRGDASKQDSRLEIFRNFRDLIIFTEFSYIIASNFFGCFRFVWIFLVFFVQKSGEDRGKTDPLRKKWVYIRGKCFKIPLDIKK